MRVWFKYEFGFINIDDNNLYLTNTGNWSETKDLKENTCGDSSKASNRRKGKAMIYFIIFGSILLLAFLTHLILSSFNPISLIVLVGIPLGAYMSYQYMKTELGNSYCIPLQKISYINIGEKKIVIHFLDKDSADCSESLVNVSEDGLEQLKRLFPGKIRRINEQQ